MGIRAKQPFLPIRFKLTVSRSSHIPFDTLVIIQEHRQFVSSWSFRSCISLDVPCRRRSVWYFKDDFWVSERLPPCRLENRIGCSRGCTRSRLHALWRYETLWNDFLLHDLSPELLKDETAEADLISPTLPAFRSLLAISCHPNARERYGKLVHGLLSSCLLNVDEMRFVLESNCVFVWR